MYNNKVEISIIMEYLDNYEVQLVSIKTHI